MAFKSLYLSFALNALAAADNTCAAGESCKGTAPEDDVPGNLQLLQTKVSVESGAMVTEGDAQMLGTDPQVHGSDWASALAGSNVGTLESLARQKAAAGLSVSLSQADFQQGTYRITQPGVYTLTEDISFNPSEETDSFPPAGSAQYPAMDGYFLGFFAAISIETDGVVLNLNGKTIGQSPLHYLRQRFFTVIELASRPFIANAGPPQFSKMSSPIRFGTNVVIENGVIGLSAHHGIHGNRNAKVFLKGLTIKDFEVAGIALNGGEKVLVKGVTVGPSLGAAAAPTTKMPLATLSQARLLGHVFSLTMADSKNGLAALAENTQVTLRGKGTRTVRQILDRLREAVGLFISDSITPSAAQASELLTEARNVFSNAQQLPDGSAVYGIVFHKTSPAVHDFGACNEQDKQNLNGATEKEIVVQDVDIKQLKVRVDNVVMVKADKPVLGPAGDLVQLLRVSSCRGTCSSLEGASYEGSVLSDAQLALAVLKNAAIAQLKMSEDEAFQYFGGINMPQVVLDWAADDKGSLDTFFCASAAECTTSLQKDAANRGVDVGQLLQTRFGGQTLEAAAAALASNPLSLGCQFDAMAHLNKGAVGLRLEFVDGVSVSNTNIQSIENVGQPAQAMCQQKGAPYLGADARGVSMSVAKDIELGEGVNVASVRSGDGFAYGVEVRGATGNIGMKASITHVEGQKGSHEIVGLSDPYNAGGWELRKTLTAPAAVPAAAA